MSYTLQCYTKFAALIDGTKSEGGSIEKPVSITVAGQKEDPTYTVANAANTSVYANAIGSFVFAFLQSDMNTRVVLTDTESQSFSLPILGSGVAGKFGLPLVLGGSATLNAATTINSIVVHNDSGSSAQVRAFIVK